MNRVCVFCGSSSGSQPHYREAAAQLGEAMVSRNIDLVYGGASIGLMGAIADSVLNLGGKAFGVIPTHLERHEISHQNLTELIIVDSMHERKAAMADMSDGFIAMPGGIGTLEELIEICTWQQLGLHTKPTGLLDVEHYYKSLLEFLDHSVGENFLRPNHRKNLLSSDNPETLLNTMLEFAGNPDEYLSAKLEIPR